MEAVLDHHSFTLQRGAFSQVPLAGIANDLVAISTNQNWVKFQGPAKRPNYLVVNMTREQDAPGLAERLKGGAFPHLRAEVAALIKVGVAAFEHLPHVAEALAVTPGLLVGCDNVYVNVYCDDEAMMDSHVDGPVGEDVLWARGISKHRLARGEQGLHEPIPGTEFYLIGSPIGDSSFKVQRTGLPGELTLNGARVLKYGQSNLVHRYQPGAGARRLGPICSVQASFMRLIYIYSHGRGLTSVVLLCALVCRVQFDLVAYKPGSKSAATKRVEMVHGLFGVSEAQPQLPVPVLQALPASLHPGKWHTLGVNRTASSMGKSIQGGSHRA